VESDAVPGEQRIADCMSAAPADPADLSGMDDAARRKALVDQAARFSMSFARWTDSACSTGLSYQQLRLLDQLGSHGPAIMREIGRELGVSPRNMTAMVDSLEQADLVVRRPHPSDRRATLIALTPDGIKTAEKSLEPRLDAIAEVFASFSVEEQQQFYAALARIIGAMQQPNGAC
jgi:DNA-binding MarR family transcriptional regulator